MLRRKKREEEEERNKDDFGRKSVIDEATLEGNRGSDDQFYDAQVEVEEPVMKLQRLSESELISARRRNKLTLRVIAGSIRVSGVTEAGSENGQKERRIFRRRKSGLRMAKQ
ncbi:hypothetical protein Dimus_007449, partial [Dionaea muscipula]